MDLSIDRTIAHLPSINPANSQANLMVHVKILDGGLGTSLEDLYNIKFDSTTPLWASHLLVSDPATLQKCQRDFGIAGVDILLTATYQVSAEGFARTKTAEFPDGIPRSAVGPFLRKAVDIAEKAKVADSTSIALSLGPYGACMVPGQEYSGVYDAEHDSEESLYLWHLDRLRMFAEADDDICSRVRYVAFETLPRVDEVRAVRRAIRDSGFRVPFWVSCVFPRGDNLLPDGSSVEQVVQAAVAPMDGGFPWGIGINCTKMHEVRELVDSFSRAVAGAVDAGQLSVVPSLVLYPDGTNGEVYNTTTQVWEKIDGRLRDDHPWETQLSAVVHGACAKGPFSSFVVGGCCKASHHDIKKLGEIFKR